MQQQGAYKVIALFIIQIILCVYGTQIFVIRANPFALLLISGLFTYYCALLLRQSPVSTNKSDRYTPWLHALFAVAMVTTQYNALRRIFESFPDPGLKSDVLPQLTAQAALFFSGQFPYQPITTVPHHPYPVYLPLQWLPLQLSNSTGIDQRWPGIILLAISVGFSGYLLRKYHAGISLKYSLPATLLLVLPLWGFVKWSKVDLALSSEGIVAFWYILLATGLAIKKLPLIVLGIIGGLLSRYSLLFWLPLFASLLWYHEPKRYSFITWGIVGASVLCLFVFPFLLKDPSILTKMSAHYGTCVAGSWVNPDEYTFLDGLSLNIHLREWIKGNPTDTLKYAHFPQFGVQVLCVLVGFFYYRKKGYQVFEIYTYALIWLSIMPMLLYLFSPMLFKYYMLMPLSVSAVLCWKVVNTKGVFEKLDKN
jgi:hypothetical protein